MKESFSLSPSLEFRELRRADAYALLNLYQAIAAHPGGFSRDADEISPEYIEKTLDCVEASGVGIVISQEGQVGLIGSIVASKIGPKMFDHVLSDLVIGVHPDFQSKGIGRRLFLEFLDHVQQKRPDILRVELIARESNLRAISFYESIGFRREGVLEQRIRTAEGFEADVPMGWLKRT